MRDIPEWVGRTDDAKIPDRVALRIFVRCEGKCHITGRKILPGEAFDLEHIRSLRNGGEHRESNIALALRGAHRKKTAAEATAGAKADRIRKKHIGIHKSKTPIRGWRKFNGEAVYK